MAERHAITVLLQSQMIYSQTSALGHKQPVNILAVERLDSASSGRSSALIHDVSPLIRPQHCLYDGNISLSNK
jgi:hypothetical protein